MHHHSIMACYCSFTTPQVATFSTLLLPQAASQLITTATSQALSQCYTASIHYSVSASLLPPACRLLPAGVPHLRLPGLPGLLHLLPAQPLSAPRAQVHILGQGGHTVLHLGGSRQVQQLAARAQAHTCHQVSMPSTEMLVVLLVRSLRHHWATVTTAIYRSRTTISIQGCTPPACLSGW